jgi:hypothetical protein
MDYTVLYPGRPENHCCENFKSFSVPIFIMLRLLSEAICSSEMLADFHCAAKCYILEDITSKSITVKNL